VQASTGISSRGWHRRGGPISPIRAIHSLANSEVVGTGYVRDIEPDADGGATAFSRSRGCMVAPAPSPAAARRRHRAARLNTLWARRRIGGCRCLACVRHQIAYDLPAARREVRTRLAALLARWAIGIDATGSLVHVAVSTVRTRGEREQGQAKVQRHAWHRGRRVAWCCSSCRWDALLVSLMPRR
jgi:hypothetical protein